MSTFKTYYFWGSLQIDLSQIKNNKLKIKINEEDFEISWHPDHFKTVEKSLKD